MAKSTMTSDQTPRPWLAVAALAGLVAVALDALGAHAMGPTPDAARVRLLELAMRYQMIHALALLGVAVIFGQIESRTALWLRVSAWAFTIGIVLFCGGLTARALGGVSMFAPLVPIGGTALLIGWAALFVHALRTGRR